MANDVGTSEYFDLTYSSEPASYYYLIIQIDDQRMHACWYHSTKNLVTGFASYPFDGSLKKVLDQHEYLQSEFKEVIVCLQHPNYLVYPRALVDGANSSIFQLTNSLEPDDEQLLQTDLVNTNSSIAFTAPHGLLSDIYGQFKHVKVISHVAPRIEHELNSLRNQAKPGDQLIGHVWGDHLDIRCYRDGRLALSNSYFQSGKEDIAYYILYASEILGLDPESTPLHVSGAIKLGDDTWNLLSKYWKSVSEVLPLPKVEISKALEDYAPTRYEYLTHALLCVS